MIKIYDLLFEQDNTSSTSTTLSTSSSGTDVSAIKKGVKDAIEPLMKTQEEQNKRITSYLDTVNKGQKKSPPPVSPATSSTTGTVPTGPSTPAGMSTANQPQDLKNFTSALTKSLTNSKPFIDTLASKINFKNLNDNK